MLIELIHMLIHLRCVFDKHIVFVVGLIQCHCGLNNIAVVYSSILKTQRSSTYQGCIPSKKDLGSKTP